MLTTVEEFCHAWRSETCPDRPGQHSALRLEIAGATPGRYTVAEGTLQAWFGDVPKSCRGSGLGATDGVVTVNQASLEPHGVVKLEISLQLFSGQVSGEITAAYCP